MTRSRFLAVALGVALAFLGTVALASRNSSGTMSAPALNPVTTGSTITIAWANGTINDIVSELSDSLSRSGKGGMLAPLRTADGTIAAPAHAFTSEPGLGFYRSASGVGNFVSGGTNALIWSSSEVKFMGNVAFPKAGNQTIIKSGSGTLSISSSAGNIAMSNVVDPSSPQDVSTKNYVDSPAVSTLTWTDIGTVGGAGCTDGAPSNVPQWAKFRGVVYLRGNVGCDATGANTTPTLTALPVGARPGASYGHSFPVGGDTSSGTAGYYGGTLYVTIAPSGVFGFSTTYGPNLTIYFLAGISFPAEN